MKLKNQLFWMIFLIGTSLTILFNITSYKKIEHIILEYNIEELENFADEKAERVKDIIRDQITKGNIIAKYLIRKQLNPSCINRECRKEINQIISNYLLFNLKRLYVLNKNGKLITSTDSSAIDRTDFRIYLNYAKNKQPYIDCKYHNKGEILLISSIPLWKGNEFIGVLVMEEIDCKIIRLTNDYSGLRKSGETYLAKQNSTTRFINPLRFKRKNDSEIQLPINDTSYSINKAFIHKYKGTCVDCKDYRGIKVISHYQKIPNSPWAIVTEIDKNELFQPIQDIIKLFAFFALISFLLIAILAHYLSNYITKPLEQMIQSINKFKLGNLSSRSEIKMKNEIGTLSNSFNEMADTIENNMNKLNKSNHALNKFGYTVSHDLKGPLQSIFTLADMIKKEYANKQLTGEGLQMLEMLNQKSKMMEEMIGNVLSMAKKGGHLTKKEKINTNKIVNEVLNNITIPSHFKITIEENLPEIQYNKTALFQIFMNLLTNAVKYNDKEQGLVDIGTEDMKDKYCFFVRDNGQGIKEKDYYKIFNIFSSAEDISKRDDSSGIGLSTAKSIITENFGEIWVDSEIGKGSTFYFTVPK